MPRPNKCRKVKFHPVHKSFAPCQEHSSKEILLNIDELEAVRLADYMGLNQQEAADSMEISRGTYQRILVSSRKKIADALINGNRLKIGGGTYEFCPEIEKNPIKNILRDCENCSMCEYCTKKISRR